jgi:hypothetical protein
MYSGSCGSRNGKTEADDFHILMDGFRCKRQGLIVNPLGNACICRFLSFELLYEVMGGLFAVLLYSLMCQVLMHAVVKPKIYSKLNALMQQKIYV